MIKKIIIFLTFLTLGIASISAINIDSCQNITASGTYTLNTSLYNVTGTCFDIQADNVDFDCQGNEIIGEGSNNGFEIVNSNHFSLYNCNIVNFHKNIYVLGVNNSQFSNINSSDSFQGLEISSSINNSFSNFMLNENFFGTSMGKSIYYPENSNDNMFNNFEYINNTYGLSILAELNYLNNVTFFNSEVYDINFFATQKSNCALHLNNVSGNQNKKILFFNYSTNISNWNNNFSSIIFCGVSNIHISNMSVFNQTSPYIFSLVTDSFLYNISNINSSVGMDISGSNLNISMVTIINNSESGILTNVDNSYFSNIYSENNPSGLFIASSNGNIIENYTSLNDYHSIYLWSSSSNNNLINLSISNSSNSIDFWNSDYNTLSNININHSSYVSSYLVDFTNSNFNIISNLNSNFGRIIYLTYDSSNNNSILDSTFITNNSYQDIRVDFTNSSENYFLENYFDYNEISLTNDIDSDHNTFLLNNFLINSISSDLNILFNSTFLGNYWSDLSCSAFEQRGSYNVCVSPNNYSIAPDVFDFAPLVLDTTGMINLTPTDTDGDGIMDALDKINGSVSDINTNLTLTIEINSSTNLSQIFNTTQAIQIKENSQTIIEFDKDFSTSTLDLTNITIQKQILNNISKFLISGLTLDANTTKTIYFTLQNNTKSNSLCIKDQNILDFSQITSTCTGANEIYVQSIPYSNQSLNITYQNQTNKIVKIQGLSHSAIAQTCTEEWEYPTSWTTCSGSSQSKTPTDANSCGTTHEKPATQTQSCTSDTGSGGSGSGTEDENTDELDTDEQWFSIEIDHDFGKNEIDCELTIDGDDYDYTFDKYSTSSELEIEMNFEETIEFDCDDKIDETKFKVYNDEGNKIKSKIYIDEDNFEFDIDNPVDKDEQWFLIEIDHDFDNKEIDCELTIDGDDYDYTFDKNSKSKDLEIEMNFEETIEFDCKKILDEIFFEVYDSKSDKIKTQTYTDKDLIEFDIDEIEEKTQVSLPTSGTIIKEKATITNNYNVLIEGSNDLTKTYNSKQWIEFKEKNTKENIIEFEFDFSKNNLNLTKVEIITSNSNTQNYILIKNLELQGKTKTIKLPIKKNSKQVCIKDEEISQISQISTKCDGANEKLLTCNGKYSGVYMCDMIGNYYLISGLSHSGVLEYEPLPENLIKNQTTSNITSNQNSNQNPTELEKALASSKTQTDEIETSSASENENSSSILYWIFGGLILTIIIIIILVIISKRNEIIQDNENFMTSEEEYAYIKNYVQNYEKAYNPVLIKKELLKAGFEEEMIDQVISEEFPN